MAIVFSVSLVFISCVTASIWTELASYSNITSSHSCKRNGTSFVCEDACQVTDSTDDVYDWPFLNQSSGNCTLVNVLGMPNVTSETKGFIFGGENCTGVNTTFDGTSWTISFWVKYNGTQSRNLLEVQSNNTKIAWISTSDYGIGVNNNSITLSNYPTWTHITLRMTDRNAMYLHINGSNKFVGVVSNISRHIFMLFGSQKNSLLYVHMVDARIYNHSLTDREIAKLSTGILAPKLEFQDNCLCPRNFPTVLPGPQNYGINCTDHTNKTIHRLKNETKYLVQFAIDGDENTYWNSGTTKSANITLDLKNVFQLSSVDVLFKFDTSPSELVLTLIYNGRITMRKICECNSTLPCGFQGGKFTYNLTNGTDLTNRSSYNTLLADTVDIQLNGSCSDKDFYAISEVVITGSCHCSLNSDNCQIFDAKNRTYNCLCRNASNTDGSNCETCKDDFWRNSTFNLTCQNRCSCNSTGSFNRSCNEIDGRCYCKRNVTGPSCDQCEHNFYNFSSNGCTRCKCSPDGITNCSSTGQCLCKPNVEMISGTCKQCKEGYYGFGNQSGCTKCGCNEAGSTNISCSDNGSCSCKVYVTGRTCDQCIDSYWKLDTNLANGCIACECNLKVGSINNICDKFSGQCPCFTDVETDTSNSKCIPELTGTKMIPTFGPASGGTKVTLTGQHLGIRNMSVKVFVRTQAVNIIARNLTKIVFKTTNQRIGSANVTIHWIKKINETNQEEYLFSSPLPFEYRSNASIQKPTSNVKLFSSGLCNIEFRGQALDSVYQPEIVLYGVSGDQNITGPCSHPEGDSTSILCIPPDLPKWVTNGTYNYGVVLDGITDFLNMSSSVIEIQPDPLFHTNREIVYRNLFDKLITVQGEGFRRACAKNDFSLYLNKRGNCEIKDFTDTEITCDPKESFPGTGEKETLKIFIGRLEKEIGIVEFRTFWKLQEFVYICIGVGAFLLTVIIAVIVSCICRRRYRQKVPEDAMGLENVTQPVRKRQENEYVGVVNPMILHAEADLGKSCSELFLERLPQSVAELVISSIIDKSQIEIGIICTAKGTYTRVINGKYANSSSTPYTSDGITIKTLVENYSAHGKIPNWLSLGLQECTRLRDVVHDNVLRLRGIAIDEKKIYVVYPAMERTLKDYIHKNYSSQAVKVDDVIAFCFDVGEGMKELHKQGIVHKDLAARNCMVDSGRVVKVADASFASDMYPLEYMKQHSRDLPVRWMAVESLQQIGFYDKATDMWSYGVLLWEIFTGCRDLPYQDISDDDIHLNVAMQGYRLRTPENIPKTYLKILDQSMNTDSNLRPTFEAVLTLMNNALENPEEVFYQNQEENYVNRSAIDQYMNKSAIDKSVHLDQRSQRKSKA